MSQTLVLTASHGSFFQSEGSASPPPSPPPSPPGRLSDDPEMMNEFERAANRFEDDYPEMHEKLTNEFREIHSLYRSIKDSVAQQNAVVDERLDAIEDDMSDVRPTLVRMFEDFRDMEKEISRTRPLSVGVMVRRTLDDARFCVLNGFKILFQSHPGFEFVLNRFDPKKKTVEWGRFRTELNILFGKYIGRVHTVRNGRQVLNTNWRLKLNEVETQKVSVFEGFNRRVLLAGPNGQYETSDDDVLDTAPISTSLFRERQFKVGTIGDRDLAWVEAEDTDDRLLYEQLQFFFPVFIWAYTELKMAIVRDIKKIKILQESIDLQHRVVTSKGAKMFPMESPPSFEELRSASSFDLGTARAVRDQTYWKDFISNAASRVDAPRAARRRRPTINIPFGNARPTPANNANVPPATIPGGGVGTTPAPPVAHPGASTSQAPAGIYSQYRNQVSPEVWEHMTSSYMPESSYEENAVVANAMTQAYLQEKTRADAIAIYELHLVKYVALVKFISIFLDNWLLDMAVFGRSYVRRVTCFFTHDENVPDAVFEDALKRFAEIAAIRRKVADPLAEPPYVAVDELAKLAKLLASGKEYFFGDDPKVERSIETYLEKRCTDVANDRGAVANPTDLHLFVNWSQTVDIAAARQ